MINYSVFKGSLLLCNSYLKREIRKGLKEKMSRLLISNSFNVNERLLIYYKNYKFNKKKKLIQCEKITHLHLPTMKSLNALPLSISGTK